MREWQLGEDSATRMLGPNRSEWPAKRGHRNQMPPMLSVGLPRLTPAVVYVVPRLRDPGFANFLGRTVAAVVAYAVLASIAVQWLGG